MKLIQVATYAVDIIPRKKDISMNQEAMNSCLTYQMKNVHMTGIMTRLKIIGYAGFVKKGKNV